MITAICSRCKRERDIKYLIDRKVWGKTKTRCRARSVCSSKARRLRKVRAVE